jgi:hypothetical protein
MTALEHRPRGGQQPKPFGRTGWIGQEVETKKEVEEESDDDDKIVEV